MGTRRTKSLRFATSEECWMPRDLPYAVEANPCIKPEVDPALCVGGARLRPQNVRHPRADQAVKNPVGWHVAKLRKPMPCEPGVNQAFDLPQGQTPCPQRPGHDRCPPRWCTARRKSAHLRGWGRENPGHAAHATPWSHRWNTRCLPNRPPLPGRAKTRPCRRWDAPGI